EGGSTIDRDAQLVLVAQRLDQDVDIHLRIVDDENAALGKILHVSGSRQRLRGRAPVAPGRRQRRSSERGQRDALCNLLSLMMVAKARAVCWKRLLESGSRVVYARRRTGL